MGCLFVMHPIHRTPACFSFAALGGRGSPSLQPPSLLILVAILVLNPGSPPPFRCATRSVAWCRPGISACTLARSAAAAAIRTTSCSGAPRERATCLAPETPITPAGARKHTTCTSSWTTTSASTTTPQRVRYRDN